MARAKRTNRAEARRRYRAQLAEQETAEASEAPPAVATQLGARGTRTDRAPADPPRPGMRYAFRAAFHEPKFRDDLAHLPQLLRSRAVVLPVLVTVATAAAIVATKGQDVISNLAAQYFLATPPIGSIFIAGFFAPRASYIAGAIVGLVAALALTAAVAVTPVVGTSAVPGASPSPGATAPGGASPSAGASSAAPSASAPSPSQTAGGSPAGSAASPIASPAPSGGGEVVATDPVKVAESALLASPVFGILFASAAAWYRRFLQLSNPNRAAAQRARTKQNTRRR